MTYIPKYVINIGHNIYNAIGYYDCNGSNICDDVVV